MTDLLGILGYVLVVAWVVCAVVDAVRGKR